MGVDKIFKELFPDSKPSLTLTLNNGDLGSATWAVPENLNKILSKIHTPDLPKQFIHYTNCDGLFGILNSCQLRLYNLYNLNDSSELKYALKEFDFDLLGINYDRERQYTFVTSLCSYDIDLRNEDFNMWRLYGREGTGAALVFEIENHESISSRYTLGKVHYGKNSEAFNYLKEISQYYYNTNNLAGVSMPSEIPMMCMLYKHEVWKIENEFRLFIGLWYDDKTFRDTIPLCDYFLWTNLNHFITERGEKGAFTSLPFNLQTIKEEMKLRSKGHDIEPYFNQFPHLKLKQVILGHNMNKNKSNSIANVCSSLVKTKLDYQVQFLESRFKDELQ